jgi:hypothetical protein
MLVESSAVEPSPLCPDPGRATWEEKEEAARTPLLCPSSLCTTPTVVASPPPTHSTSSPRPNPSSMPPRPPRTASAMHVARTPAQATYWTPSPSASWPIKTPSEHTNELTPLPASPQTSSLPPVRSRSQQPSTPASYWTREAPPRSASVGQADAGKWRRSAAGVFSAPRRQALLPLRASPSPSSSSLRAGELPPSPLNTTQTRRWIRIQRQRTGSGDLSHLTRRPHMSVLIPNVSLPCEAVLGRPIRDSSESGPVQLVWVRIVFIYFPLF